MIIRIDYPQPAARLDLWGGTSGVFNGLDRFNRIVDQRWQNNTSGTPADIDRYQYGCLPSANDNTSSANEAGWRRRLRHFCQSINPIWRKQGVATRNHLR